MGDPEEECYFPESNVERIGNVVMIQCHSEDDAIIVFEMFKELALGHPISFRRAEGR